MRHRARARTGYGLLYLGVGTAGWTERPRDRRRCAASNDRLTKAPAEESGTLRASGGSSGVAGKHGARGCGRRRRPRGGLRCGPRVSRRKSILGRGKQRVKAGRRSLAGGAAWPRETAGIRSGTGSCGSGGPGGRGETVDSPESGSMVEEALRGKKDGIDVGLDRVIDVHPDRHDSRRAEVNIRRAVLPEAVQVEAAAAFVHDVGDVKVRGSRRTP